MVRHSSDNSFSLKSGQNGSNHFGPGSGEGMVASFQMSFGCLRFVAPDGISRLPHESNARWRLGGPRVSYRYAYFTAGCPRNTLESHG